MMATTPPRIYCIPATEAPVVAVFLRGPSDWCHLGRWDLAARRYEPGARVFGSTILRGGAERSWLARRLMATYHRKVIFSNRADDLETYYTYPPLQHPASYNLEQVDKGHAGPEDG